MRYLTPVPKQFVDQSGIPYSDGTVSVYLSGDSELADIYEDADGDALYPNPCRLDSNGAWQCFVPGGVPLDYIIKDKNGNVVFEFYNVLPSGGDTAVYNIMGVEGETVVTKRSNAEGNVTATVGLDPEFKQRVTDAENDIGDLNERVNGVEGSVDDLARDIGEVDGKVEDVADDVEGLHSSLNNKKDRQTPYSVNDIPPDRTVKSITQDANGRLQVETQPIQYPDYSQRFGSIENEQTVDAKVIAAALNDLKARMESVEEAQNKKNIGERIADILDSQNLFEGGIRVKVRQAIKSFDGETNKTITNISQDENGVITVTFSAISLSDYEKTANKKTSVTGNEGSNTYYPTIKALVDYLDSRLQNLGGKKITNNGQPFTNASQLPTTTPYYGQNINSDDYAYVQDTGLASRYTAVVTGSSVAWTLDYEIALPAFTAEQQAAIDSGVTSEMLDTFLTKTGDGSNVTSTFTAASSRTNISSGEKLSTLFGKIAKWFSDLKAVAFSGSYTDLSDKPTIPAAANNGVLTIKQNGTSVGTFSADQSSNTEIKVTDTTYESKSEASGGTAVSLVTTGEKYTWNHKQNALPTSGTPSNTYAINISGASNMANYLIRAYVNKSSQTTKIWKKIATSETFTNYMGASICFLYNHSGYVNELGLDSIVSVSIHTGNAGSLVAARIDTYSYRSESETQLLRIGSTNQYEVWVKVPTSDTNMYATVLNSYGNWTINTDDSKTGQLTNDEFTAYKSSNPSIGTSYNYNIVKASKGGVGSSTVPVYVDQYGRVNECDPMAKKASSGNGTLAVIDANGDYASSGIGAYAQSQLNSAITNSVIPWLTDNSYIVTHSFWIQTNASVVGRAVEFVNSYTGENLLRISVSYDYVNGEISFILPWSNASWNGWIIANPDPQSTAEVGGAIITANGTKHTSNSSSDTVTPFYTHTEETIHSNNVSQTTIGTFNVGKSTMYDTSSYYDFVITLFNGLSSKRVTLKISMSIDRYVSGSGTTANIIGMATIDASGLNI